MSTSPSPWAANSHRQIRLARSGSLRGAAFRLLFSLWLLYALALVAISGSFSVEEVASGDRLPLLPATFIRIALLIGLAGFAILSALHAARGLIAETRREATADAAPARDFLAQVAKSGEEYALVLRPHDAGTELFLPVARPVRERLRDPAGGLASIEQLIAAEVERTLGIRTIGVVDPEREQAAPGLAYVAVGDDWRTEVEALISRAHSVFLVVPPAHEGADLGWELAEIFRKGLIGRAAVVLPPRPLKRAATLEALTATMIPHATAPERAVLTDYLLGDVILVHLSEEPEFWADAPHRFGRFARTAARPYAQAIAECLKSVAAEAPPRAERYPYFHATRRRLGPRLAIVPPAARSGDSR